MSLLLELSRRNNRGYRFFLNRLWDGDFYSSLYLQLLYNTGN